MKKREFGDFQTPAVLANLLVNVLKTKNLSPEIIVEPTCGEGSILIAAHKVFNPQKSLGIEIQKVYTDSLNQNPEKNISILNKDFFISFDFEKLAQIEHKDSLYYKLFGIPVVQNLLFA